MLWDVNNRRVASDQTPSARLSRRRVTPSHFIATASTDGFAEPVNPPARLAHAGVVRKQEQRAGSW
jgi:hypothetical protein